MESAILKKALCVILMLAMVISMVPTVFAAELQERAVVGAAGKYVISQTDYPITSGVTESQILLNNAEGNDQVACFMMTAKPQAQISFKASYHGYYTEGSTPASRAEKAENLTWGMDRTTDQAANYEKATGDKVIFATNGDYYNMQTAQPLGYLVMEGNVVQTDNGLAQEPYFAVLKDGSFAIRDYGTPLDDVQEAVSGPFYLVKDGVNVANKDDPYLMPRNAIGMKEDGTVVTCVVDGRQAPYSSGLTIWETAELMLANGVVDCIYLDGGGSATYASVREGTEDLIVRNSPSDGPERTVASALLMVSTAPSDGNFDHASLYPKNQVYTPGSSVQMEAIGVDKTGAPAEVPADLNWYVPAGQGTISEDGIFTAKAGYYGQVDVSLRKGNTVYGTTTLQIADIDDLYFVGESISLDFNSDSDLGLTAKSEKRFINYKVGDFTWEINSLTEGVQNADFGVMNGNIFHTASADQTLNGTVTVSYTKQDGTVLSDTISVEIGKLPVVMQDFEPDENGQLTAAHFHMGKNTYHYEDSPYGPGYVGDYPELTVITGGTYSGAPTYTTLTAPYAFTGNYDSAVPAAPIFNANGYTYYLWPNGTIDQYMAGDLKTISREDGGQVRSGDYALELDYDYASYNGSANANFYIRYCGEELNIEGYPTEVGVWIYAPEGTANYMIACDIAAWNGNGYSTKNLFLTAANGSPVINWTGWMYCSANIESLHPFISEEHPLKIRQGEGLFWLSYQPGKQLGGRYNGSLYFDDYRFVYGTNLDDLVNPEITSVSLNGVEIAEDGSTVIDTSSVEIKALFNDPESKNRSGVDASKTVMFIDNKNISVDGSDAEATTRTTLGNGPHTITVQVADGDGNMANITRSFTVAAADASNAKITVTAPEAVTLGGKYVMEVKADGVVNQVDLSMLNINSDFCKVEPEVAFTEGVTGTSTYTPTGFKKSSLVMNMTAEAGMTGTIATITFTIPEDVDREVDFFMYQINNITFTDKDGNEGTDAYGLVKKVVEAYYDVTIGPAIVGREITITVTDINGDLAADVTVYFNGAEIGKTNEQGQLTTDVAKELPALTDFIVTARSDKGLSFEAKGTVFTYAGNEDALPTSIQTIYTANASTSQTITWFSNLNYAREKAYIRFMTEQDYQKLTRGEGPDTDYITRRGTCEPVMFPISKSAAGFNSVTLTDLTPDTTYVYWVGDGSEGNWSEKCTFHTEPETKEETSFYVLSDTQMLGNPEADEEAISIMNTVLADIGAKGADFGIVTGDYIDNGGTYGHYQEMLDLFQNSAVASVPLLKTLGNHEYYGDLSGDVANKVFSLPGRDYYSVETNGVYVAVINNSADLDEAMQWLAEDAAKSECQWKFLSVHQPAYYTNVNGGSNAFHEKIPAVAEAAGIDIVFSGHDHSYARTEMLKDGRVVEDDGTVYMICGDMGEKSRDLNYAATNDPNFHFAMVSQEYEALYVMVKATAKSLTVTAYNLDGTIMDSFTKTVKEEQPDPGPDDPDPTPETHNYVYNRTIGTLICTDADCGMEAPADYTGWATDSASGKKMYFIGGKYQTGWFTLGDEVYHFDAKTGEAHIFTTFNDVKTTCVEQGYMDIVCSCGEKEHFEHAKPSGHVNEQKTTNDGTVYYVCKNCGRISKYNLSFADVMDDDWFAPNVAYVVENGLFAGRNALTFDPDTAMTRVEFVSVIWRLAGKPEFENTSKPIYSDCNGNAWYSAAVNWSTKYGIINGVGDNLFDPDGNITREQIVTILYRYAEYIKLEHESVSADYKSMFVDGKTVSEYADQAMSWAVGAGLIQGDEANRIVPQGLATRAEVATMIMRYHKLLNAVE